MSALVIVLAILGLFGWACFLEWVLREPPMPWEKDE
jgi:hypothetical protein